MTVVFLSAVCARMRICQIVLAFSFVTMLTRLQARFIMHIIHHLHHLAANDFRISCHRASWQNGLDERLLNGVAPKSCVLGLSFVFGKSVKNGCMIRLNTVLRQDDSSRLGFDVISAVHHQFSTNPCTLTSQL